MHHFTTTALYLFVTIAHAVLVRTSFHCNVLPHWLICCIPPAHQCIQASNA